MSIRNLKSLSKKKYQRAANKIIRGWNKSIKEDWLWNGRFVLSQKQSYFYPYDDRSGGIFYTTVCIHDMKTGKEINKIFDQYGLEWHLGGWINDCIVKDWNVWKENPDPYGQAKAEGREPPPLPAK